MRRIELWIAAGVVVAGGAWWASSRVDDLATVVHGPNAVPSPSVEVPDVDLVEVPMHVRGGRFVVRADAPDGTTLDFGLSTGNPPAVLSASTAERLGAAAELTFGGLPIDLQGAVTVPDADLGTGEHALDGLIGSLTLNQYDVLLDAPGERLLLRPAGPPVDWDGVRLSEPVSLRIYHGVMIGLDVTLNGREYPAMLDLGTPAIAVNEPVGLALGLADGDRADLAIGPRTLGVPLSVRDEPIFERWDPAGNGFVIVGAPIAHTCAISLSWVRRELRTCVR